jgi:hypothetical protein
MLMLSGKLRKGGISGIAFNLALDHSADPSVDARALFIAAVRILHRTGYSGSWSVVALVPIVNVIMLWIFSKADWPAHDARTRISN